jgi:hypothetical protein
LAPRIDWILKLQLLGQVHQQRPWLDWRSPEMKHLDHLYGTLDPGLGLFWAYEARGAVEWHVSEDDIVRFEHEPPGDTRAWGRAMLLRAAGLHGVYDMDWDRMRFREPDGRYWPRLRTIEMDDPLGFTKTALGDLVGQDVPLGVMLDMLGASPPTFDLARVVLALATNHEKETRA